MYTRVMYYGECMCQSILHFCISGTWCGHIKGSARFFFLRTDLCTCEHAVFGFIQNSCCVEGSYHCFMAGSTGKNDTTLIPCGKEGVWSAGSSGSSGVVAVMSATSLVVSVFTVGGQKQYEI